MINENFIFSVKRNVCVYLNPLCYIPETNNIVNQLYFSVTKINRSSLAVQWLGPFTLTTTDAGSILLRGLVPQASAAQPNKQANK